jgi:hypothetical protein
MNKATIDFHQTILRLGKGMLKAYEDWIHEESVTAMVETLKQVRQHTPSDPARLETPIEK